MKFTYNVNGDLPK